MVLLGLAPSTHALSNCSGHDTKGILFFLRYGCQVNIYMDGTVGVGHSGVEVGQGIDTKVAQCVAHTLGIPLDLISIDPTTSFVATNADPTGGSITSGLNRYLHRELYDGSMTD